MTSDDTKGDTSALEAHPPITEKALALARAVAEEFKFYSDERGLMSGIIAVLLVERESLPKVTAERDELATKYDALLTSWVEIRALRDAATAERDALSARVRELEADANQLINEYVESGNPSFDTLNKLIVTLEKKA
jgi:hypothetical protein